MTKVTVSVIGGKIVIASELGDPLEIVAEQPPVDPPPVDPPPPPPPPPPPDPEPGDGIWISQAEIDALPMSGAGWTNVLAAADANPGSPSLADQNSGNSTAIMACALVYARTKQQKYLDKVTAALRIVATGNVEKGTRALALGRELIGYVLAADIVSLKDVDPSLDTQFRTKLKSLLTYPCSSGPANLVASDNERPNNWGGHAGASRIAVDLYLGDLADLEKAAKVLRGWCGDRTAYAGFKYGELDWQADPAHPVGVNPAGSMIQGHPVGGLQPEEMRRSGGFVWPPSGADARMYSWESLQGRVAAAKMLQRAGYDSWQWSDRAILRAVQALYDLGWSVTGDDLWQPWVINRAYGTTFTGGGGGAGKNVGWTMWTEQ